MSPDPVVMLEERLRTEEGWRAQVYDDATGRPLRPGDRIAGHPTIGYGFALDLAGIDREEGEFLLRRRVSTVLRRLEAVIPFWAHLDAVRKVALAEMAYQMGVGRRDNPQTPQNEGAGLLDFDQMLQALAVGDAERAGVEARASAWYRRQTPARAERVARMLETGKMPGEA